MKRNYDDESLIVYHGSKKGLAGKISPISRASCDFGKGFYLCGDSADALTLICGEEKPVLYTMKLDLSGLKVLEMKMDLEWALLIACYRGYMDEAKGSEIYKKYASLADGYDVVLGYIADDRMYRVMKNFFEKEITDVSLIHSLSALDLGYQYVCKTPKACEHLEIISSRELSPLELGALRDKTSLGEKRELASLKRHC